MWTGYVDDDINRLENCEGQVTPRMPTPGSLIYWIAMEEHYLSNVDEFSQKCHSELYVWIDNMYPSLI